MSAPQNAQEIATYREKIDQAKAESIVTEPLLPAKVVRQAPVSIDTLLTKAQFVLLVNHMMNNNPVSHFLTVWRDPDGNARFSKARAHPH